ncbi:MAG: ImmA/IrrE family metallo-endopeptidase [Devosia sp.]|uniref:ImmA/IrrE family metallo-endopeptidase n=1 Tax=Devosia sp. TaxID=1871048 RepID=UPI0026113C18|nr:ImmA/IrrE family metallo-endopeptidase [Devosia sp.]MDB5589294.1 ImmA/IrrE family metallo-endopeptidase [Devosia sp.]
MKKRPNRPMDPMLIEQGEPLSAPSIVQQSASALDTPERIIAFCRSAGLINGVETDIEALIRLTPNLELSYADISPNDAYIEKVDDGKYKIVINSGHPRTRQRFSMAHEYVHFQMHRSEIEKMPKGEMIMHRNDERNRIEYQANRYAGIILMPEDSFRAVSLAEHGKVEAIASKFGVSSLSVRFRARDLGIAGHGL